jgi:hypothetical protein
MEIASIPTRSRLTAIAASTGRTTDEFVREAIELWEQEQARALAEFRESFDEAEASIAREEGIDITPETMRQLSKDIMERCRARLEADRKAGR